MFSALQAAGVTLKPTKLQFSKNEIGCLGHAISEKGISISADRIKAILALPEPEYIIDNRGFLGTVTGSRMNCRVTTVEGLPGSTGLNSS